MIEIKYNTRKIEIGESTISGYELRGIEGWRITVNARVNNGFGKSVAFHSRIYDSAVQAANAMASFKASLPRTYTEPSILDAYYESDPNEVTIDEADSPKS